VSNNQAQCTATSLMETTMLSVIMLSNLQSNGGRFDCYIMTDSGSSNTCASGNSSTCHPTQVNASYLNPSQTG